MLNNQVLLHIAKAIDMWTQRSSRHFRSPQAQVTFQPLAKGQAGPRVTVLDTASGGYNYPFLDPANYKLVFKTIQLPTYCMECKHIIIEVS